MRNKHGYLMDNDEELDYNETQSRENLEDRFSENALSLTLELLARSILLGQMVNDINNGKSIALGQMTGLMIEITRAVHSAQDKYVEENLADEVSRIIEQREQDRAEAYAEW